MALECCGVSCVGMGKAKVQHDTAETERGQQAFRYETRKTNWHQPNCLKKMVQIFNLQDIEKGSRRLQVPGAVKSDSDCHFHFFQTTQQANKENRYGIVMAFESSK